MHDVRIVDPLRHLLQQSVVPNVVKVSSQVKVENTRLPLDYRFSHPLNCVMCCLLGPISKRSRLEVRLEHRFEDELERALHHSIPDRRNRKNTDFVAPVFRYLLLPSCTRARSVRPVSAREEHLRLALRWLRRSLRQFPERHRFLSLSHTLRAVSPSC